MREEVREEVREEEVRQRKDKLNTFFIPVLTGRGSMNE